ncbi:MAG: hypothetical protein ACYTFU_08625 [Planctomycetota bacterium]
MGQNRPPGVEVEQAQDEVEVVQPVQVLDGQEFLRREPGVGATIATRRWCGHIQRRTKRQG